MFKKVLIVEDLDSIIETIKTTLEKLAIPQIEHVKYCDDAILKIKKAQHDKIPFELIISDLSFKEDHRENKIKNGEELITAIKKIQPEIKTIIFSIEDKSFKINSLFDNQKINAYVVKGRNSINDIKTAVLETYKNNTRILLPEDQKHSFNKKAIIEIEAYDIQLLQLLSKGYIISEITTEFKKLEIQPNSNSSIEKRINKLKTYFKANNNVHLIAITKDLGLI